VTNFTAAAADYLATRRAMGYKLADHDSLLRQFAGHLESAGTVHLTVSHALTWATQQSQAAPVWVAAKLGVVRGFARYLSALDPATEIPPVGLLTEPSHMIVPHIYADEEVSRLLEAAGRLHPQHRADTYRTVIALLAVTGMRVGEAVRLDDDDIDFEQGLLTIRRSKYGKSRQLPLHASTLAALAAYGRRRDLRRPRRKAPSFFTSTVGTRLLRDNVSTVFPRLVRECGLTAGLAGRRPPRLHDLRHTFAVRCLIRWYREGVEVEPRLPLLSTYLGHIAPSTTYWYLSAVPELLELIAERMEAASEVRS